MGLDAMWSVDRYQYFGRTWFVCSWSGWRPKYVPSKWWLL